ncbi:hypothetical protein, partial [Hymenobacter coccineus]|uniref:hypothetical protein n=1 Tax=Hymenobacter coccineus TaxID=1908235 RepID=UPI0019554A39
MKNILTAAFAAAVLLVAPSAFAAPAANQKAPAYSPAAQGPAYYGGPGYRNAYDRGPRPGYRAPYYRPAGYYRAPAPRP